MLEIDCGVRIAELRDARRVPESFRISTSIRHAMTRTSRRSSRLAAQLGAAAVVVLAAASPSSVRAQQVADSSFNPPIAHPAHAAGEGPLVLIDEAHHDFHTAEGRYAPFAALLRRDGYRVEGLRTAATRDALAKARILVIANALGAANVERWEKPIAPAFTGEEVAAIRRWVEGGGSLLLISDHMPFPGAIDSLARALGFEFANGFAMPTTGVQGPLMFRRSDGSLHEHPITDGRTPGERIDSVATFTGSAFRGVSEGVRPLLVYDSTVTILEPDVAWEFSASTPRRPAQGWYIGATRRLGRGRVMVMGEAAMFSAQLGGPQRQPMGMNSPQSVQNPQFLLNAMHWLEGTLEAR